MDLNADLNLTRIIDATNKQLRAGIGTTLDRFAFKELDKQFIQEIESQIGSTLTDLVGQGIIHSGHSASKLVGDQLTIDITLRPVYPANYITTTITLDPRSTSEELTEEDRLEEEERRIQIYIENKSW